MTVNCPVCKGKGVLSRPKRRAATNRVMAQLLRREGYSIREIMRFLGYKSPRSVSELLER